MVAEAFQPVLNQSAASVQAGKPVPPIYKTFSGSNPLASLILSLLTAHFLYPNCRKIA